MENNREYYIKIDGEKIPVTEEVYRAYWRPRWAEHKRRERENRCINKGSALCKGECNLCDKRRSGRPLSMEKLGEDGFQIADSVDVADLVVDKLRREALRDAIDKLEPDDRYIIISFYSGLSERQIAANIGLSQKGVNKRKQRIFARLCEELQDFA